MLDLHFKILCGADEELTRGKSLQAQDWPSGSPLLIIIGASCCELEPEIYKKSRHGRAAHLLLLSSPVVCSSSFVAIITP
jgi:hypothetical protein